MKSTYPLPVVLLGRDDCWLAPVRLQLAEHGATIAAEYPGFRELSGSRADLLDAPPLFLCHVGDLAEVRRLRAAFAGRPILALTEDSTDAQALFAAMRAGASQVVALPLDPDDFRAALDCIAAQFGGPSTASLTIAVSGVTGGCGATTLAGNLAYELAEVHLRETILSELTRHMGMFVTHMDIEPTHTLADLTRYAGELDREVVHATLVPYAEHLRILAGPSRPMAPAADLAKKVASIVDCLRQLANIVVLDLPCTFDDDYFELLSTADQIILVGEQRIPAVRNVQLVLDALGPKCGRNLNLVLNRYDQTLSKFTSAELAKLLGLPRVLTMGNDPSRVALALNHGQPLRIAAPGSPVLEDIDRMVQTILGPVLDLANEPAKPSVFRRLRHAFGLA